MIALANTLIDVNGYRKHIGFSPGGSTWVAYRPRDVETMKKRLAALWARWRLRNPGAVVLRMTV